MSGTKFQINTSINRLPSTILSNRGWVLGTILVTALIGFEMFNFSTTQVALHDLLGDLKFVGITWATILSIAFCGIDFAGIARLFIPESQVNDTKETWYLFGAWLLAATMNALLTWWGVSLGMANRTLQSSAFIQAETLVEIVPIFVALLVWVTRILLIGTFSVAGPRLFTQDQPVQAVTRPAISANPRPRTAYQPVAASSLAQASTPVSTLQRPAPRPSARPEPEYVSDPSFSTAQPAYHSLSGRTNSNNQQTRQF